MIDGWTFPERGGTNSSRGAKRRIHHIALFLVLKSGRRCASNSRASAAAVSYGPETQSLVWFYGIADGAAYFSKGIVAGLIGEANWRNF